MKNNRLSNSLERFPIIAAVQDNSFEAALYSPAEVFFYLKANLLTLKDKIDAAHNSNKIIFVHIDLADGIE